MPATHGAAASAAHTCTATASSPLPPAPQLGSRAFRCNQKMRRKRGFHTSQTAVPTFPLHHQVKGVLPGGVVGHAGNHATVHCRPRVVLLQWSTNLAQTVCAGDRKPRSRTKMRRAPHRHTQHLARDRPGSGRPPPGRLGVHATHLYNHVEAIQSVRRLSEALNIGVKVQPCGGCSRHRCGPNVRRERGSAPRSYSPKSAAKQQTAWVASDRAIGHSLQRLAAPLSAPRPL